MLSQADISRLRLLMQADRLSKDLSLEEYDEAITFAVRVLTTLQGGFTDVSPIS
jgi:hypothetical protein